jgi:hypothetical protein
MHKIINSGGWYVGGGAVVDWIDSFEDTLIIRGDFNVLRIENGIMDMIAEKNHLNKLRMIKIQKKESLKGFYRVTRLLVNEYTKNILSEPSLKKYNQNYYYHFQLISKLSKYQNLIKRNVIFDEISFWKDWLDEVVLSGESSYNCKHAVFQNPFFYDETFPLHRSIWPKLFEGSKIFFLHRDPLDQFADIVNNNDHIEVSWNRVFNGLETMDPADRFYTLSKKFYHARLKMAQEYERSELVIFSFEDFIMYHDAIAPLLLHFFGIKSDKSRLKNKFKRNESLKNIGIGANNDDILRLFHGKEHIIKELNQLRNRLSRCPQSMSPAEKNL